MIIAKFVAVGLGENFSSLVETFAPWKVQICDFPFVFMPNLTSRIPLVDVNDLSHI